MLDCVASDRLGEVGRELSEVVAEVRGTAAEELTVAKVKTPPPTVKGAASIAEEPSTAGETAPPPAETLAAMPPSEPPWE